MDEETATLTKSEVMDLVDTLWGHVEALEERDEILAADELRSWAILLLARILDQGGDS